MRKLVILLAGAATLAAPALAATQNFMVGNFSEVSSAGSMNVVVTTGKGVSVRAEGAQKDLDRLDIRVEGGALKIGTKREGWMNWGGDMGKVTVYVTAPSVTGLALAGSGDLSADRVRGDAKLRVAGSGDLKVGAVDARSLAISVAGSGNIAAGGRCQSANVSIAGSGDVDIPNLKCETIAAKVAGSGNVSGFATKTGTVSIAGSGDVRIAGGAKCSVKKVDSGEAICG